MNLEARASYLVLHDQPDGTKRQVAIVRTLGDAIANWTSGSRVSPIWRIRGYNEPASSISTFQAKTTITFIGPIQPARLPSEIGGFQAPNVRSVWATAGCFNIIIETSQDPPGIELAKTLQDWSVQIGVAFEQWTLEGGVIQETHHSSVSKADTGPLLARLAELSKAHDHPSLRTAFQENLVATATSLARAAAVYPPIFESLLAVATASRETVEEFDSGKLGLLEVQSRMVGMNAALSRFSSQAFSGIPPIEGTECHFWIHSLLGTGSANIALHNLVSSVQSVLGEAKLPERLSLLSKKKTKVPTLTELASGRDMLVFDLLDKTKDDQITDRPIIPLVTYFSGRDGFSSQVQTLSAPLTTLSECNSLRSNLLTVTHEISHIFVQAALAHLSPSLGNEDELAWARAILSPRYKADSHLNAARQLLLEGVLGMEQAGREALEPHEVDRELPDILERWRREMQEILVHSFDFLYFHAGDPDTYITNIWHSWCAIPGIADRVPEYLMRTLCAVSANLLAEKPETRFQAALQSTKRILEKVGPEIGVGNNYVSKALHYIARVEAEAELSGKMESEYSVRIYLVRLVRIFLFSETLAARLFSDPYVGGGEGYRSKRSLIYDGSPIGNGLNFLRTHLKANPAEAESTWVLHCLAFDMPATTGRKP